MKRYPSGGGRRAVRRPAARCLPVAVVLLALVLVLAAGRSLLFPAVGAQQPAASPAASPAAPSEVPAPDPPPPAPRGPAAGARAPVAPPAPAPAATAAPGAEGPYDYAAPVPLSGPAPEDWFSDAAFLGDSLTDGLLLYSGIQGADNLAYKGLTVLTACTDAVIRTDAGKVSALEALGQKDYGKVYILLGVNELGWYNAQRFYDAYADLVDQVRESQPDAQIYLQTLLPVTAEKSAEHEWLKNEKIAVYNDLIAQLAEEKQVYLLDTHSALADEEDALPAEDSTDGVHLTRAGYKVWLSYLQEHIVPTQSAG